MKIGRANPRNGLTLLEVVVAMAIFLISLGAIYQLVSLGSERAMDVKVQSRASLRCQSKLNECIVGLQPLQASGSYAAFDNDTELPTLLWKVDAEQDTVTNLWDVKVYVKADLASGRTIETVLCQMVLDPSVRGSTLDQPNASATTAPTTSPTTPAASSSSTTPATGGAAAPTGGKRAAARAAAAPEQAAARAAAAPEQAAARAAAAPEQAAAVREPVVVQGRAAVRVQAAALELVAVQEPAAALGRAAVQELAAVRERAAAREVDAMRLGNRHKRSAFSLLEMMLALSIGLVLLAALYITLNLQINLTQAGRDTIEEGTKARFILTRVSNDVMSQVAPFDMRVVGNMPYTTSTGIGNGTGGTIPASTTSSSSSSSSTASTNANSANSGGQSSSNPFVLYNVGVYGTNNMLRLSTYRVQSAPPGALTGNIDTSAEVTCDLRRITYWMSTSGNADMQGLCRKEFRQPTNDDIDMDPTTFSDLDKCVIAKEVTSLTFEYLNFDGVTWEPTWDGTTPSELDGETPIGPPLAIRITITLRRGPIGAPGSAAPPANGDTSNDPSYQHIISFPAVNFFNQAQTTP